jgi:hypothetical protein
MVDVVATVWFFIHGAICSLVRFQSPQARPNLPGIAKKTCKPWNTGEYINAPSPTKYVRRYNRCPVHHERITRAGNAAGLRNLGPAIFERFASQEGQNGGDFVGQKAEHDRHNLKRLSVFRRTDDEKSEDSHTRGRERIARSSEAVDAAREQHDVRDTPGDAEGDARGRGRVAQRPPCAHAQHAHKHRVTEQLCPKRLVLREAPLALRQLRFSVDDCRPFLGPHPGRPQNRDSRLRGHVLRELVLSVLGLCTLKLFYVLLIQVWDIVVR